MDKTLAPPNRWMRRALELAERGRGQVAPNPLVGCVIVRQGRIIAEGWHAKLGQAHAEAHALAQLHAAGDNAAGATVYVSLEPCSHYGRTPPCADALIAAGVAEVVIACRDPNPRVDGRGIAKLQAAGIGVRTGVLAEEAEQQNEVFFTNQRHKRPFVLYKTAMTLDGKIATSSGASRWISGEASRARVQQWRSEYDAIAVGINTVLRDNPQLTCRLEHGRSPVKVIFDSQARTPPSARLFDPDPQGQAARVLIFCQHNAAPARSKALQAKGAELIMLPSMPAADASAMQTLATPADTLSADTTPASTSSTNTAAAGAAASGGVDIGQALQHLHSQQLSSVLLEGGGHLAWSFFAQRLVDKVAVFIAPKLLGGSGASPLAGAGVAHMDDALRLEHIRSERLGDDTLFCGYVRYPQ